MIKILISILSAIFTLYIITCIVLYAYQERIIFRPQKLAKNYTYEFPGSFKEKQIRTKDGINLNGLLFKGDSSKGLIFYLHGNAGSLKYWGEIAPMYTILGYDFFIWDYRGFGKSEGNIINEEQFHNDVQFVYNELKKSYNEDSIIIIGYSIGTGPAGKLASTNHPKLLVLQAPYYNLSEMMTDHYPMIPTFILQYGFNTNVYLKSCKMPVVIFHGDHDGIIDYKASLKLKKEFKSKDTLIILKDQRHNGLNDNPVYREYINHLLL